MARRIQLRRDTATAWAAANPVLTQGEIGLDLTSKKIKIGDGTTLWNALAYWDDKETDLAGYATELYVDNAIGAITIPTYISQFGEGFSLTAADKIVTNKLYSTNLTQPNQHYRLEVDTNGVVVLPDSSIINGSTIRGVAGTGELNYTGITIGPNSNDAEKTWMWVDHANAYVSTNNSANTWTFGTDGDLTLPAGGDIVNSSGQSVLGSGTTLPYLELTDTPFITQPAILGTPVTVTAAPRGIGAQVVITITEGSVLDSITIFEPGTGYVAGQNYIIWSYQIGGPMPGDSLTLTIGTVDGNGGILTVTNVQFLGVPQNVAGVYTTALNYQASVFDEIDTGLTLTRDLNQGIYNVEAETEYDNSTYLSPLGTEWNADGWGDLTGLATRTYTTWRQALNNAVGTYIVASELVMHDTINDKYYKFDFTAWGGENGSFAYTRTEVTDPNYFKKANYATANDVDVIEDDSTLQIGITRGLNGGIYNPFTEEDWNSNVSPDGTLWNVDGWNDLTDVETRTYTNFYTAYDELLGNLVPGSQAVMYVPSIDKYYAIEWISWTQGIGGNTQGGGFSYTRREIDLTKLDQGITFPDGTVLKSAQGIGRVKSTASGNRRIEEVTGYNQVTVTERTTGAAVTTTAALGNELALGFVTVVVSGPQLTALNAIVNGGAFYDFEVSSDQTNWFKANWGGTGTTGGSAYFQLNLRNGVTLPVAQGATVYYRITTGGDPVVWWNKTDLPGGSGNFRGAVIDYHAYTGDGTIIGTIHIVDDDGEEHISHQEVQSGSTDGENDDLWLVTSEGQIRYRRIDGESATLKIHWTAKVFYGNETYD